MLDDLRFALRLLGRQRGYALMASLTFAVGVGANAAVFSVADSVLFRPLPFAAADRLFAVALADPATGDVYATLPAATVAAARATGLFEAAADASPRIWRAFVRTSDGLDALTLSPVSREYLDVLGLRPAAGRSFDASDTGTRAVILSHDVWQRRYGGDASVIGTTLPAILRPTERAPLSQPPVRVVGVLPPRVRLPLVSKADGLVLDEEVAGAGERTYPPLVRLRAGVSAAEARARLRAVPPPGGADGNSELRLVPIREDLAARQDAVLWLLLAAAAIVLLAACVNLANLTFARGVGRAREVAIRASLGSPRFAVIRLFLVESLCIAVLGTAIGLLGGYWGARVLSTALPPLLAQIADPAFDRRAFVFTLATAASATALFAIVPALRLTRQHGDLRAAAPALTATRRGPQLLVAVEVAVCVALVVGASLVGRTLLAIVSQDLGFAPHRLAVTFDLPTLVTVRDGATRTDIEARAAYFRARLRDVREVPGVQAAALASATPFSGWAPDAPLMPGRGEQRGGVYGVSAGYFTAMAIPLLAGRDLTDAESFSGAPVGVLNQTAARLMCGTAVACLGRVVQSPGQPARAVVGVVADTRRSLERGALPAMYVPFLSRFAVKTLVIAADRRAPTLERIKRALTVLPDARVDIRDIDDAIALELSPYRFNAIVTGGFAVLTLLLAIVGVYGVMAAVVGQRTREYGVRLALGATRARVNRDVLAIAARPIGWGIVTGVVASVWAVRYIGSLLYGVVPLDPVSFAVAAAVLLVSGLAAALVPAMRASRVDPIIALRAE